MKFKFIGNAGGIFTGSNGTKILCDPWIVDGVFEDADRHLYCYLDLRLLNRILHKKAHWNNAEIGTHINFKRIPNKMDPDVHTCMSFFHI